MTRYLEIWYDHAIRREGKKLKVYNDTRHKLTVGIGHLVTPADNLKLGQEISDAECTDLFLADTAKAEMAALRQARESGVMTDEWIAALISVNFQLGTGWIKTFGRTWEAIKAKRYTEAQDNLRRSTWAKQTPVRVEDFIAAIEVLKATQKPILKSRTMRGATAGIVATLGTGVSTVVDIADKVKDEAEPYIGLSDTIKLVFIGCILIGFVVVAWARIDDNRKGRR